MNYQQHDLDLNKLKSLSDFEKKGVAHTIAPGILPSHEMQRTLSLHHQDRGKEVYQC